MQRRAQRNIGHARGGSVADEDRFERDPAGRIFNFSRPDTAARPTAGGTTRQRVARSDRVPSIFFFVTGARKFSLESMEIDSGRKTYVYDIITLFFLNIHVKGNLEKNRRAVRSNEEIRRNLGLYLSSRTTSS